jgi:hypothetical protein
MNFSNMDHPITYVVVVGILAAITFYVKDRFRNSRQSKLVKQDQDKIYRWLMGEFRRTEKYEFRSTKAISSGTHLSEDRVREVAITDSRIHKSTGSNDDLWSVKEKPLL